MLSIHILNVGHGDSIVLEYHGDGGVKNFAVIDSNCEKGEAPRALEKLRQLGAESLSFVALTHPHADHYMGLAAIMEAYAQKIDSFYTFPLERPKGHIKRLAEICEKKLAESDSNRVAQKSFELIQILGLGNKLDWQTPSGPYNKIGVNGFKGVEFFVLLPPAREKGRFFQEIMNGELELEKLSLNDVSLAFQLKYGGASIILAGDGTYSNWVFEKKQLERMGEKLRSSAVKLPHHGSAYDCKELVIDVLYEGSDMAEKFACISANGISHPAPEVIKGLVKKGIKPYCTNFMAMCGAANDQRVLAEPTADHPLARFIDSASMTQKVGQACQGDIVITIDSMGAIEVKREFDTPCPYRGDLDFLSTATLQ